MSDGSQHSSLSCSSLFHRLFTHHSSRITHHFSPQPGFRQSPIAHDGARRNLQDFSRLINAQPAKETQLNNLTLSLIYGGQVLERFIERNHLRRSLVREDGCLVERNLNCAGAALAPFASTGITNQDSPHRRRSDTEELCP